MTAAELAQLLEAPLEGDGAVVLSGGATLDAAGPEDLVFIDSRAAIEEIFTMAAPLPRSNKGRNARTIAKGPRKLIAITRSHASTSCSWI